MNKNKNTPESILQTWVRSQKKSKAQFCRDVGYKSNYGYLLLNASDPRPVTFEVVGRLLVVYGADGPAAAIAEAMRAADKSKKCA